MECKKISTDKKITIRIDNELLSNLKEIAKDNNTMYQRLMKQVLRDFCIEYYKGER